MRRNFPRPYTTTYLRVVVVGQLVALADSEITAFLPVVLTGFVTVSFHSIRVAVSFDAVSAHAQPVLSLQSASPSCHAPSILAYLPGLPLRVPRRWWMVQDSNLRWSGVPTFPIYCLVHNPLTGAFDLSAQPSFYVLCFWRFR